MRLIDSNALIGALHNVTFEDGTDREIVYRCVELAPTIEERKTGKWIDHSEDGYVECPLCSHLTTCEGNKEDLHYCFWCGTRMEVYE